MEMMAYFDSTHDLPVEIITAAGFNPYKIMGDVQVPIEKADPYLASFFCPSARSCMVDALSNGDKWAGIVFGHGCDATNRHFDIWKAHVNTPFLYWLNVPLNTNETAAKFFKVEMKRFIESLEKQYSIKITGSSIENAITQSNIIKKKLQELGALRSIKDIPNVDYFDLIKKCLQIPKNDILPLLDITLADWQNRLPFPKNKKRILLTGSDITYREFMEILERADLRAVRDDLSVGERYYATLIPENSDALDALIDYHFNIPRPPTKNPPVKRLDYLLSCMKANSISGIISQNVKYCEPFALDAVLINNALKEKGYQLIHLERDFTPNLDETLINRLQAFAELL